MNNLISISDARANLRSVLNSLKKGLEEINITEHGKIKAVLVDPDYLESLKETAEILSTPGILKDIRQSEKEIKEGRFVTLEELLKEN